jgi:hypothetical protein
MTGLQHCHAVALCAVAIGLAEMPAQAQPVDWSKIPRMQLERQFAGPLKDTIIQRLRDPVDGTVCMIYLPINAPHSPQQQSGYVQYGSATIGTMSCFPGGPVTPVAANTAARSAGTTASAASSAPARPAAPPPQSLAPVAPASLDQRFQASPAEQNRNR